MEKEKLPEWTGPMNGAIDYRKVRDIKKQHLIGQKDMWSK